MWNQWASGPPPIPPTSNNPQSPLIGPVLPAAQAPPPSQAPPAPVPAALPAVPPMQTVPYQTGAPTYTPAQYAAMTPEQQYAVQQHWQQWQAYEQQYAQWHAQYGEQYKREMAAIQSTPAQPAVVPYSGTAVANTYNYPPPAVSNPYPIPPVPTTAPPPPPPDDNSNSKGIKAPAQIYEQPPPPPPLPQETSMQNSNDPVGQQENVLNSQNQNLVSSQPLPNQENRWSQPPPFSTPNLGNRRNGPNDGSINQQNQYNQQNQQNQYNPQNQYNQQNQFNQQNQYNQQNRQQNQQFNQQDRSLQNDQQFNNGKQQNMRQNQNNNYPRNQQENEQERNNRQGNRQNNNFGGRNRSRSGNNYENERQFDDSDGRNNNQYQSWQQDNSGERNNRGNFTNRFDNSYDNFDRNLGQNQQNSNNWQSNMQSGNFGTPDNRQRQISQNQSTPNEKPQNQSTGGSVDEKVFDEQFRLWEEQFENWKKENANHPDRDMYMKYEREFEKTRVRLLERREQMRRRKMMEMQQKSNLQNSETREPLQNQQSHQSIPTNNQQSHQPIPPQNDPKQLEPMQPQNPILHPDAPQDVQNEISNNSNEKIIEAEKPNKSLEIQKSQNSDMEQSESEDCVVILSCEKIDKTTPEAEKESENKNVEEKETENLNKSETTIFKKQEMTELFKSGGGIPGLDLVGSKDGEVVDNPMNENEKNKNVMDSDTDGPTRPPKIPATSFNSGNILTTPQHQQMTLKDSNPQFSFLNSQAQINQATPPPPPPAQRKIPSLFDIVVEKPVLSPEACVSPLLRNASPAGSRTSKADIPRDAASCHSRSISRDRDVLASPFQRPQSQMSTEQNIQQSVPNQQQSNLPPQAADLAKALQDPNVMQLLSVALAQAQKSGCLNPAANAQQNQLLQQLQQLQPLIQMQQERSNNRQWDNNASSEMSQHPQQSQSWQNQSQNRNQDFDNRQQNTNMNHNVNPNNRFNSSGFDSRNQFDDNSFNNDDRLSRRPGSSNLSDGGRDMPQKNPRNPFRRGNGPEDTDNGGNKNLDITNSGRGPFESSTNNAFGGLTNLQQQRGGNFGGNFENDNFGKGNFTNDNFGRGFSGGRENFRGRNFGGRNFDDENFNRGVVAGGGDNFGRGDNFKRGDSFGGGNNFGGGHNFGRGDNFEGRENFEGRNNFEGGDNSKEGDIFNNPRDNNYDGENFAGGRNFNNRPDTNFNNSLGYRNNANKFGDRGVGDNDFYRPKQIFDYQNRSRPESLMPAAKVVDYGHKPSALLPPTSFGRDNSEFVPVKTIDYGHAKAQNAFQDKSGNQKSNKWNQSQDHQQQQQRNQNLGFRGNANETNSNVKTNNKEENENPNCDELSTPTETDNVNELESEKGQEYPRNKWILQNPESRQRPGPPTKRGKRNSIQFDTEPLTENTQPESFENDEIEENFEEISDNECITETADLPSQNTPIKKKTVSLFPSVSDSNKTPSMVIPSNENNNTIPIDEILFKPGRLTRPKNIVIIIRGPPGSGKSHVAKLIKEKEVEMGGQTPRLLSVDDYFMVENDYEEKCPKTGRKIPKKEILYEYEKEMEPTYMQYLIKSFKKTVTDHLFDFIIVDCCNQSLRTFNEFYNAARDGNFSPFVIDLKCKLERCLEQNIHNRKEEDIKQIIENYQDCPRHYIKLDVSNLLENVVEMEDVSDLEDHFVADSEVIELDDDDDEEEVIEAEEETTDNNDGRFLKSKWDTDPTTENLARLDGTSKPISKRGTATLEEYLQIDGWEPPSSNTNGKKRVRWADIEEKRAQDKMRAIGFVVGQTDWNRMMDPTSGSGALTKTKYIERLTKRR